MPRPAPKRGHRLPLHLSKSRHGVYYFRWPIPAHLHPVGKRSDVKVSTGLRCPRMARKAAIVLILTGQSLVREASLRGMRYDEIRRHVQEHFREQLRAFRERIAADGPREGIDLVSLSNSADLAAHQDAEEWASTAHDEGAEGLLRGFCRLRGIEGPLSQQDRRLLVVELHRGAQAYAARALASNGAFATVDLEGTSDPSPLPVTTPIVEKPTSEEAPVPYAEVVGAYLTELETYADLAPKTLLDRRAATGLLGEITGDKPVSAITKEDVRGVKETLMRLPKNRNKSRSTRGRPLAEQLEVAGAERIGSKAINEYLGNMRVFFEWAVKNGYAESNVFQGVEVQRGRGAPGTDRLAFTSDQMKTMLRHLTEDPYEIVKSDTHKWGALIAAYSGMRVNEIAQLLVSDVKQEGGVWLFDVTEEGGQGKRLKSNAAHRRVPVHSRLLELGFLDFREQQRQGGDRLFPDLTYSKTDGYGRNLSRWFNDRFLTKLNLKSEGVSFHCFRHTVNTRLNQSNVPERQVGAILGHAQSGMTYGTYFKEGFLPHQLQAALNTLTYE